MTLLELLQTIRDMGQEGARVRRVKFSAPNVVDELELDPPESEMGPTKTVTIPIPQEHGDRKTEDEMRLLAEIEQRHAFYGASQGSIPSDYVERS